jgi:putative tryptophan/tyrosine transport system substrate-binding protein
MMRRREFIGLIGGATVWPIIAHAQDGQRVRRLGILFASSPEDQDIRNRLDVFAETMRGLGWIEGRNLKTSIRTPSASPEDIRKSTAETVSEAPDVILTTGNSTVLPLMRATRSIPIIFTSATDPVGGGLVDSLAEPGGNVTGFMLFDYSLSGKWLELLKQIMPEAKRAAVVRDPTVSPGIGQFAVIQSVAPPLGIDVLPVNAGSAAEIQRSIETFARKPNSGLIVTSSAAVRTQANLIIGLAAKHALPAVYYRRTFIDAGGLISYGPNPLTSVRLAAGYVDRIMRGAKPADLPVQAPTRYEMVVNLRTAKTLGLNIPPTLLARADEVIE